MGRESKRRSLARAGRQIAHEMTPQALGLMKVATDLAVAATELADHFAALAQQGEKPSDAELAEAAKIREMVQKAQEQATALLARGTSPT